MTKKEMTIKIKSLECKLLRMYENCNKIQSDFYDLGKRLKSLEFDKGYKDLLYNSKNKIYPITIVRRESGDILAVYINKLYVIPYENKHLTLKEGIAQFQFNYNGKTVIMNTEKIDIPDSNIEYVKILNSFIVEED